jgi:hypothetical protein
VGEIIKKELTVQKQGTLRVVALLAMLSITGCSGAVHGPVIEGNRRNGGTDAEVSGVVVIEADCLYLQPIGTDIRYPVVWPHGTSWNHNESAIELSDGTLVYEGDEVRGGGGYHYLERLSEFTVAEGVERALACVDNQYGEIAVFNSNDHIGIRR